MAYTTFWYKRRPNKGYATPQQLAAFGIDPTLTQGIGLTKIPVSLLANPEVLLARNYNLSQTAADRALMQEAMGRALVQFGEIPQGVDISFNQTLRDLANLATSQGVSTLGQLRRALDRAKIQIADSLAGRGIYRSGALGYQLGEAEHVAAAAEFEERNRLMEYLSNLQSTYASSERERQRQLAEAILRAQQMLQQQAIQNRGF